MSAKGSRWRRRPRFPVLMLGPSLDSGLALSCAARSSLRSGMNGTRVSREMLAHDFVRLESTDNHQIRIYDWWWMGRKASPDGRKKIPAQTKGMAWCVGMQFTWVGRGPIISSGLISRCEQWSFFPAIFCWSMPGPREWFLGPGPGHGLVSGARGAWVGHGPVILSGLVSE
jgi:hypothetical protein